MSSLEFRNADAETVLTAYPFDHIRRCVCGMFCAWTAGCLKPIHCRCGRTVKRTDALPIASRLRGPRSVCKWPALKPHKSEARPSYPVGGIQTVAQARELYGPGSLAERYLDGSLGIG